MRDVGGLVEVACWIPWIDGLFALLRSLDGLCDMDDGNEERLGVWFIVSYHS